MTVRRLLWRVHGIAGKQGSQKLIFLTLFLSLDSGFSHERKSDVQVSCENNRTPLERSGKDFTIMKVLPSGVYQYRFIVDGQWRYAPDMPWIQDEAGSTYNILDLQVLVFSLH